jgi:hypothetical protein
LLPGRDEPINNSNIQQLSLKFGDIVNFFIVLSRSLPGHATEMRHKALVGFYSIYNRTQLIVNVAEEHREAVNELQKTVKHVLTHYLDKLLELNVLLGTGQISNPIVHESANIVYKLFDSLKERMNELQIAKAI